MLEVQSAALAMFGLVVCILGLFVAVVGLNKEAHNVEDALQGEDVEPAKGMGFTCLLVIVIIVVGLMLPGILVLPGITVVR